MLEPLLDEIEGRRKRALREILSVKDELVDPNVDARSARDLRAVIVDQVNALAYLAQNMVRAAAAGSPDGQPAVEVLESGVRVTDAKSRPS